MNRRNPWRRRPQRRVTWAHLLGFVLGLSPLLIIMGHMAHNCSATTLDQCR